jgi:hypothetical protein
MLNMTIKSGTMGQENGSRWEETQKDVLQEDKRHMAGFGNRSGN